MNVSSTTAPLRTIRSSLGTEHHHAIPIEQFVSYCFLHSLNQLDDINIIEIIDDFRKYINEVHSEENLNFLLAITDYEYYYNKYLSSMKTNSESLERLDSAASSNNSLKTEENFPANYFPSTMDDLKQDYWESFKFQNLNHNDEESSIQESDIFSEDSLNEEELCMARKWHHILTTFVYPNSEHQVNLSNSSFKVMISQTSKYPHPSIMARSKRDIMQLLNENAYHQFNNKLKGCTKDSGTNLSCKDCSCDEDEKLLSVESAPAQYTEYSPTKRPTVPKIQTDGSPSDPLSISPSVRSIHSNVSLSSSRRKWFWDHLKIHSPTSNDKKFKLWSKKKITALEAEHNI